MLPPALKGDQESLLLEGLPGTPQPHRLPLAGTTFQLRQGPDQAQNLEALGPLNASLIVMVRSGRLSASGIGARDTPIHPPTHTPFQVLAQTDLPPLRYRFNAPISRDSLPPYAWHYAPWTKCSAQCAGGEARLRGPGPGAVLG